MPTEKSSPPLFEHPEEYFFEADRLINEDQVNEAAVVLRELVTRFPDFGKAYNHLGFLYETKYRDPAQAEIYYKKCLELAPDYPALYLNYSVLLSSQERYSELESLLEKGLEVPGINKAKLYYEVGIMRETKAEFDQAVDAYRKSIQFSFVEGDIALYQSAIQRVETKKGLLN